ncbi:hypothetical protein OG558_19725 [Kribbella sp. NBC_01510]|uniref:hypothetical protein n=1 Tax=Kribbella sp. NBC_01510 TaxID=2903581 RepID=UPI00386D8B8A
MTDARYPERWLNDRRINRLSDSAHRAFVRSLAWSVSNRTDGRLYADDLDDLRVDPGVVVEFTKAGLWETWDEGWLIVDFDTTQTTKAQLEGLDHKRVLDRARKQRERAHKAGDHSLCLPDHCSLAGVSRVTSTVAERVTHRTGQDRTGQAFKEEQVEADGNCSVCGTPMDPAAWYSDTGRHPGCQAREAS